MQLRTTPEMLDSCQGTSNVAKHSTSSEFVLMHYETIDQLIADASEAHRLVDALEKQVAQLHSWSKEALSRYEPHTAKDFDLVARNLRAIFNGKDYREGDTFNDTADHLEADPPDHSAGLRCHKCGGRLSPPGGLGGCAACKVSVAENPKKETETRGTSAATPPPDSCPECAANHEAAEYILRVARETLGRRDIHGCVEAVDRMAERLAIAERTRDAAQAESPPDSDIRQALDEALPGWDDPDERVTVAEAIRLIHQDRASIKAAAENVLKSADPLFAQHSNDGWWIRCNAAIMNIDDLTARLPNSIAIAERTRDAAQAEANRLLEENRELRKDIDEFQTFVEAIRRINVQALLADQRRWSAATFGPGNRTAGILAHIRKELAEIEANPGDLEEWIDVILLAIDGFWRHGGLDLAAALWAKRDKNRARKWPPPGPEDQPTEHVKEEK